MGCYLYLRSSYIVSHFVNIYPHWHSNSLPRYCRVSPRGQTEDRRAALAFTGAAKKGLLAEKEREDIAKEVAGVRANSTENDPRLIILSTPTMDILRIGHTRHDLECFMHFFLDRIEGMRVDGQGYVEESCCIILVLHPVYTLYVPL